MLPSTLLVLAVQFFTAHSRPSSRYDESLVSVTAQDDIDINAIPASNATSTGPEYSESEWIDDPRELNQSLASALERRVPDLGGTKTPKGGVYPKGYTSYGRNVYECANRSESTPPKTFKVLLMCDRLAIRRPSSLGY
jgi:hypothetical protein